MKRWIVIISFTLCIMLCLGAKVSENTWWYICVPDKNEILENGYPKNGLGEAYGPDIKELDIVPDLVFVKNEYGIYGYIRVSEIEINLPECPDNVANYKPIQKLNMYLDDGITIVGEFYLN